MVTARLTDLGVGPLKARRFAGPVKGQPLDKALAILDLSSSPVCKALAKLVRSAAANATHNKQLAAENLEVANVIVDQGHMLKRIRPRARGRAFRIFKRSCHVTVVLDLKKELRSAQATLEGAAAAKSTAAKPAAKKTAAKSSAAKSSAAKSAASKTAAAKSTATKTAAGKTASKTTAAKKSAAPQGEGAAKKSTSRKPKADGEE
jgi:large subunit ribosomal protein L22